MADEPDNEGLPGIWHGPLSLRPVKEVMRFVDECDNYTKELRATHQAAVFKAHPGIRSTFVTDMAGLDFVFDAAPDVLDRLEDPGFGGLSFDPDLLGGVIPALLRDADDHGPARAVVGQCMGLRCRQFEPACRKVLHYGIPMLRSAARGQRVNFKHAMHHAAVGVAFEWLFGLTPGPEGADAQRWIKACFGLKSDQLLADSVARAASWAMGRLTNGAKARSVAYAAGWMEKIRASAPYQSDFKRVAHERGVPEGELPAHLMFAASFNATGGAWATLHPALAQLSVDPMTRDRLAAELKDFNGSVQELNRLPFFHAFFLESMRLFGRPRHYYRRVMPDPAKADNAKYALMLPVSDGTKVALAPGTTLCLVATVARQDPAVWGDDAAVFDPERFIRTPELKGRVRAFGPSPVGPNGGGYGCVGAGTVDDAAVAAGAPDDRFAAMLWKTLAAPLARATDWRLLPWPEPDVDAFDGVRPGELEWVRT